MRSLHDSGLRVYVRVLMAEELSARMLRRRKESLNEISHQAAFELLRYAIHKDGLIPNHVSVGEFVLRRQLHCPSICFVSSASLRNVLHPL